MLNLELLRAVIIVLLKFVPLSVMILSGIPYRHMRFCLMKWATTFFVTAAKDAASTHLQNPVQSFEA